jgi:hypothetical protein
LFSLYFFVNRIPDLPRHINYLPVGCKPKRVGVTPNNSRPVLAKRSFELGTVSR